MAQEEQSAVDHDVAVQEPPAASERTERRQCPGKAPPKLLPPFKVLLHNDDVNDMLYVVRTVRKIAGLNEEDAVQRVHEAHETGVSLLLTTHKERAELYREQFASASLTVTIEPAE